MPRTLDAAARERSVIEAAWRVITAEGVAALTVRRVAAEAGLAPSSLRYTFPTQASVRERAIGATLQHMKDRVAALPDDLDGRDWARAALLELLPLDTQRRVEMEVTLALGAAALTDAGLQPLWNESNAVVRDLCARAASAVGVTGLAQVDFLHALIDGLALHLVVQPDADGSARARASVELYLETVAPSTSDAAP